jgi:hypothetical protein
MNISILIHAAILSSISMTTLNCLAFTAVAGIPGESKSSLTWSWDYSNQKEADISALEGCRVTARKNGLGKLAGKCKVHTRAKGPGYGALTCGKNGCSWATGYDDLQQAVDAAYTRCSESYKDCNSKNIQNWEDRRGFKMSNAKSDNRSCIPNTNARKCKYSCTNGNCLVTYENACQIRVQVQPNLERVFEYDPSKGATDWVSKWVYPAPAC